MSAVVVLRNPVLPYNAVGKVSGASGASYGTSYYETAFGAHICRMPLEEWRKCCRDVTAAERGFFGWWEVDIDLPNDPAGGDDVLALIADADASRLDAITSGLAPVVQAVLARAKQVLGINSVTPPPVSTYAESRSPQAPRVAEPSDRHSAESLEGVTRWWTLVKIGKTFGIDEHQYDNMPALRAAILAAQSGGVEPREAKIRTQPRMFDVSEPPAPQNKTFQGGCTK